MRLLIVIFTCVFMTFAGSTTAWAKAYALLVGVSDYDNDIGLADLRGPANDVILLRDVLQGRGDFEITVLADQVPGGARPTRAAILQALSDITQGLKDGDFVYIHMSGHGTRQRDAEGDETDGLDEVFLPADTARADPGSGVIPNAIRDEELGAAVAAMRARGADVWFILDSCHSGSGLRAGGPDMASRFVDPAVLGLDLSGIATAPASSPLSGPGDDDLPGQYLAFYAAQSSEVAREIELVPGAASGNGWFGLFSAKLAARLSDGAVMSYRQLFQAVLSDLNDSSVPGAARLQTPLWEGNMIDATVLGGRDTTGIRQFAVTGDVIEAGRLHGLRDGAVVALVDDATAGAGASVGFAQIEDADATTAYLAPVAAGCVPDAALPCPRLDALPTAARYARLVASPVDLTVALAQPVDLSTGLLLPETHPLAQALQAAVAEVNDAGQARIEVTVTGADLAVGLRDGRLWFGQNIGIGSTPVGLAWEPGDGPLAAVLLRIYRAEEVARLLAGVAEGGSVLFGNPVEVALTKADTVMLDRPQQVSNLRDIRRECQRALRDAAVTEFPDGGDLNQCDQVVIRAQSLLDGPARDVNRIHIDSQFCIDTAYQRLDGSAQSAVIGAPLTVCADCPDGADRVVQKAGFERMFVVVTEAVDNAEALDLRGLLENCQAPGGATRSGAAAQSAAAFLGSMARRDATRGSFGAMGISNIWVEPFRWTVLPRGEAIARAQSAAPGSN